MEGSQFRKSRDERHRERGMERQAASIEQMKLAKGKVEEHRQHNLKQGKVVRDPLRHADGSSLACAATLALTDAWSSAGRA